MVCIEICAANCKVPKRFGRCKYYEENCDFEESGSKSFKESCASSPGANKTRRNSIQDGEGNIGKDRE